MAGKRGIYRSVHSSLLDDPDWQTLSPNARLVFITLRVCRDASIAGIFRFYRSMLIDQTGLSEDEVNDALDELAAGDKPWALVDRQSRVVWLRNALRFDPVINLSNARHTLGVIDNLRCLPKSPLIPLFVEYYGLQVPPDIQAMIDEIGPDFALEPPAPRPKRQRVAATAAKSNGGELHPVQDKAEIDAEKRREFDSWAGRMASSFEDPTLAAAYIKALLQALETYYSSNTGHLTAHKLQQLARALSSMEAEAVLAAIEIYYDRYCTNKSERYVVGIARDKDKLTPQALAAEMDRHRRGMEGRGLFNELSAGGDA